MGDKIIGTLEQLALRRKHGCKIDYTSLRGFLHRLPERERAVIIRRFGLEDGHCCTLKEVGKESGVTRERIRQIEARGLRRLRRYKVYDRLAPVVPDWKEDYRLLDNCQRWAAEPLAFAPRIEDLSLPTRVRNALRRGGFVYTHELNDEERLKRVWGIGVKSLNDIKKALLAPFVGDRH